MANEKCVVATIEVQCSVLRFAGLFRSAWSEVSGTSVSFHNGSQPKNG